MHLKQVCIFPQKFPAHNCYPFNLELFSEPKTLDVRCPVTFFVGENGTGKSTMLKAIARRCNIHIWQGMQRTRYHYNPFEEELHRYIDVEWAGESRGERDSIILRMITLISRAGNAAVTRAQSIGHTARTC